MRKSCAVVLAALALFALPAPGTAGLFGGGLGAYEDHEYDKAIEKCKGEKDLECRIVVAFSYLEKYNLYKIKSDKELASAALGMLHVDVTPKDVDTIAKFLNIAGNPSGNKEAAKMLKKAFENAKANAEDIFIIVRFLDPAKGQEANQIALDALVARLKPVREYVTSGAAMPPEMRKEIFAEKKLIEPVVALLNEKKLSGTARKLLVIIEEPSLKYLEEQELTKPVSDTIVEVKKAVAKRVKKFPDSSWSSPEGKD